MRMLLRVSIPVEAGNAAAKAGTLGSTVEKILADLKPEAAYFFPDDNGQRSGSIVFDMKELIADPGHCGAMVSRIQRKDFFATCHEPAGPCRGRSVDQQGRSAIRISPRSTPHHRDWGFFVLAAPPIWGVHLPSTATAAPIRYSAEGPSEHCWPRHAPATVTRNPRGRRTMFRLL